MKPFIDAKDAARVEAAIQKAEAGTRAELVAVVARASDDYAYVALAWAAALGLAAPFPFTFGLIEGGAVVAHGAALAVAGVVLLLSRIDAVRRLLAPKSLMRRRAARNARAQFYAQRVRMTRDRAGVLLFVSAFERHVEIIADDNVAKAVSDAEWQAAVDVFVSTLKADGPADAMLSAVAALETTLAEKLPGGASDENELSNRLIVL